MAPLTLAAMLSSCAVLAPPTASFPETPVPGAWSTQVTSAYTLYTPAAATSLSDWWDHFNDPQLTAL
ncbi:MAG: TolC family protein, partial [Polaromonas sp.]|nr:TolC family protein [Polaromonas sp.]